MSVTVSRNQEYTYQFKTISMQGGKMCGRGGTLNFNLPSNLLKRKNLWVHIKIQFDSSEPIDNRKVIGIGQKTYPLDGPQPKMLPLNLSADVNRIIDIKMDLTSILDLLDIIPPSLGNQGYFNVGVQLPYNLIYFAKVMIWKMDLIYTSQGIR